MRRRFATLVWALALLTLTGCDGPAQYAELRVNLLFHEDGTAEMWWRVPANDSARGLIPRTVDDAQLRAYGTEFAHALGLPTPTIDDVDRPATWTGLPTDRIEVDIGAWLALLESYGFTWQNAFASVCVSQREGQAGGVSVDFTHYHSCATYTADFTAETIAPATASITFDRQWPVGVWHLIGVSLAMIAGVAAWELRRRKRSADVRRILAVVAVAAPIACIVLGMNALVASQDSNPWWATGVSFDSGVDSLLRATALYGWLAATMLLVVFLLRRTD